MAPLSVIVRSPSFSSGAFPRELLDFSLKSEGALVSIRGKKMLL